MKSTVVSVVLAILGGINCTRQEGSDPQAEPQPTTSPVTRDASEQVASPSPSAVPSPSTAPVTKSEAPVATPTKAPIAALRKPCVRPDSAPAALVTIIDVIALINTLPRPVSLACFIDVLPRPLGLTGSSSPISAQPAAGADNPRIFMIIGRLVLAVVPGGEAKNLLEMSEIDTDLLRSVKGEIEFPVKAELGSLAAYERVAKPAGGSKCATTLCHGNETVSTDPIHGGKAFVSTAHRPGNSLVVSLAQMKGLSDACAKVVNDRCDMLRALFAAAVADTPFSPSIPPLFKD